MNISGFQLQQLQRRKARREALKNALALALILVSFLLVSHWDEVAAKRLVDRTLTHVAMTAPIRDRVNALHFCQAPAKNQVLVMRADSEARDGFTCATFERYDWPNAPVKVAEGTR